MQNKVAEKATSGATPTNEELKSQLDQVREDLRLLTGMLGKRAEHGAEALKGEAAVRAERLREEAKAALSRAEAEVGRARGEAEDAIRANPLMAVGGAFAIGWLIGRLARR